MAVPGLAGSTSYTDFFGRRVLLNVQYWLDYVGNKATDIPALDGERERIVTAISFALDLTEAWPIVYDLMVTFSPFMERRGDWGVWNQLLKRAIHTPLDQADTAGTITLSALLARLLQRQSRVKEAITYYRRTIYAARQTNNFFEEARACTNLGYLYIEQGQWHRAKILCCHALNIFDQIDNDHGRAHTENHLGYLYTWQRQWELARHHLERACTIWQSTGDDHGLMRGFINLGKLYLDMECPVEALPYLEKALHQAMLTGEEVETGLIYTNIGIAYRLSGDPVEAEAYAWKAEAIFRRFSSLPGWALAQDNLGLACMDQQKWAEAERHLATALDTWRNLGNDYSEVRNLLYRVELELSKNAPAQAEMWLRQVDQLNECNQWAQRYPYLREVLQKHRRSLASYTAQQATATIIY